MNKILMKRHKRQVARAKKAVKFSEPDVRTPEQLAAAREASRAVTARRADPRLPYSSPSPSRVPAATGETQAEKDS